jgi:hypothetical protein
MYFNDHAPPHFHVFYSGEEASFRLTDLETLEGEVPSRAVRLVREWARMHAVELLANWTKARAGLPGHDSGAGEGDRMIRIAA